MTPEVSWSTAVDAKWWAFCAPNAKQSEPTKQDMANPSVSTQEPSHGIELNVFCCSTKSHCNHMLNNSGQSVWGPSPDMESCCFIVTSDLVSHYSISHCFWMCLTCIFSGHPSSVPLHYILSHYCYIRCLPSPSSDPQLLVKSIAAACLHGGTLWAHKHAQRQFHARSRMWNNQNAVSHLSWWPYIK